MHSISSKYLAFLALSFCIPAAYAEENLSLDQYLRQVIQDSPDYRSTELDVQGSQSSSLEGDLIYMPRLTLQGVHTIDQRQFPNALLAGRTTSDSLTAGIEKQFGFGLNTKLSYNLLNNYTSNASPLIFPNGINQYTQGTSQIELTQPLWRNWFGKETKAQSDIAEASSLVTHYAERFHLKQIRASAETAYYRVAIAQESVRLSDELLDRSKKILEWTQRRVQNHLTDRIDLLQAQAATQARALDLENNESEERAARMAFNILRNRPNETVNENVKLPSTESILSLSVPKEADEPDDVRAARENERVIRANQELLAQKTLPDLALFGTAAFNGVNRWSSPAISNSLTTNSPYYSFGLKLSMPLYFWETSEIRSGRVKQQLAAESDTRQKVLGQVKTWSDLTRLMKNGQERLRMADELVAMQKSKLDYEKQRLNLGRTTTYQVLTFEQDYALALINRLRIAQETLNTYSQLKVYAKE